MSIKWCDHTTSPWGQFGRKTYPSGKS